MSRRWLVAVSVTAHLCILAGVFISGIWRLERLDAGPRKFALAVQAPPPPPAPAGGSRVLRPLDFTPKPPRPVAKGPRQPPENFDTPPVEPAPQGTGDGSGSGSGALTDPTATCTENCGDGPPAEPVCGNGSTEAGEQCDDGNTTGGDGCSATCRIEVKPPPIRTVPPSVLAGLRISGETQVHPDEATQHQMIRDGASRVVAVVKLCIAPDGSVGSTHLLVPTKYAAYDAALVAAVAGWRYQPYRLHGTPVPACSTVRFVYTMQ
jgi:cysteine-rich repeat protein